MAIKLDFTGVERSPYVDAIGEYVFVIADAETKDAKKGDSEVLELSLEVVEPATYNGKKISAFISFHPKALWATRLFFEALLGQEVEGELPIEDERQLIGQHIGGIVIQNGKYYNVETWFHPTS